MSTLSALSTLTEELENLLYVLLCHSSPFFIIVPTEVLQNSYSMNITLKHNGS